MGAGGIAAAFVLLVVLAALALLLVIAIVLFIVDASVRRQDSTPSPWLRRIATALVMFVVAVPVTTFAYASVVDDPDELQFDLRTPLDDDRLPGEPESRYGGYYDYDSDQVTVRLTDERRLATDVTSTVVTTDGGEVEAVAIRSRAIAPRDAADQVRGWARQLDVATPGLDAALDDPARGWSTDAKVGRVAVELSLQAVSGGDRMIARARFRP